ncbi:MAG: hypothetical protein OEU49_06160 [Chromatiales bacterium]|nr:hypothetical protein [Chromatiales bacterium]MDH4030412.1 hypothetical protein [Chromatiales bacterium]
MALSNPFKLEKLKIKAFKDVDRSNWIGDFEAMFNPESFKQSFGNVYGRGQGIGSSDQTAAYTRSRPAELNIKLLLDGTGVHEMGILQLGAQPTVRERVEEFLKLSFRMSGEIHEPNYLIVEWGDLSFSCRLGSVDITYTSFDKDGKALRAELNVTLPSDISETKRLRQEIKGSPDLSHTRLVKSGDTLASLTKEIYGSSVHYLFVAERNKLDDFRNLTPGQELLFPPLAE